MMLWYLCSICFLSSLLQNVYSFSFSSEVFFKTLISKRDGGPVKVPDPVKRKPTKSVQDAMAPFQRGNPSNDDVVNLIQAMLISTYEKLPNEIDLANITLPLPIIGALHLGFGKVKGVQSFDNPVVKSVPDNNGRSDLSAEMGFSSLSVHYDDIFLDSHVIPYSKHGKGLLWFRSNKLNAQATLVKVSEIAERLGKKCVLYVKCVELSKMESVSVDIYTEKDERSVFINAIVEAVINALVQTLTYQLNLVVNMILKEYIPESKSTVCRHPKMQETIDSMGSPNSILAKGVNAAGSVFGEMTAQIKKIAGDFKMA